MLYEELDDRFGRRKKRTVIFGMAGGTPPTPPTPPTPSVLEEKALNFYDFEGTLVASYDADEIAGLTELPEAPDHSADEVPLTFEEWNWTLAEIKEYHSDMPEATIIVGATYHPTDGNLHLIVETFEDNYLHPLQLQFNNDAEIDWGDGTSSSVSGSSTGSHLYENKGRYHITVATTSTYFSITKFASLLPKEAYISQSFTDLQDTFSSCPILEKVVIPSSVTTLGTSSKGTFEYCYSLGSIILPRSLTEVNFQLALQCFSLRMVSLPPTITTIGSNAMNSCRSLKKITLPKGLLSLEARAFYDSAVTEVSIPSSLTTIGQYCFYMARCLRKLKVSAGVREISANAFYQCESLEHVELNEGLATIGANAFNTMWALQTITIPSTVTTIGEQVFNYSTSLATVIVLATTPPTVDRIPFNHSSIKKIYVPAESVEAYKSATNWTYYAAKIEAIPS